MDFRWFYQKFQIQFNKILDSLLSLILFSSHIPISIKISLQCQYTLTYMCRALQTGFWEDQNQWNRQHKSKFGLKLQSCLWIYFPFNLVFALGCELLLLLEVSDFSHKLSLLCWPKPCTVTKMRVQKSASEVSQLRTIFLVNTINRNPWSKAFIKNYLQTWNS